MTTLSSTRRPLAIACLALATYAAILVVWSWPLAARLGTDVLASPPDPSPDIEDWRRLFQNDQLLTIATIARSCQALLAGDPAGVIDDGLCFPTPNAAVLGEHLMQATLLGLPVYALTGDPIATYNVVWALEILIAAAGMFALVYALTGSAAAAWTAGFLFGFFPERIADAPHLAVTGTHWIPWVLLAFERLLAAPTVRRGAALAAAGTLACLTGAYPTLVLATLAPVYGVMRVWQERRRVSLRLFATLAASVLVVFVICGALLAPYLAVGATWGLRARASPVYSLYRLLLPGGSFALGLLAPIATLLLVPLARASAGMVARAALVASLVTILFVTGGPPFPGGPDLTPLHAWLVARVPAIDLARVPGAVVVGAQLGFVLAGSVAAGALISGLRGARSLAIGGALVVVAFAEVFYVPLATRIYGARHVQRYLRNVEPDPAELAAYAAFDRRGLDGAFLDLPYTQGRGAVLEYMPRYAYLWAYHRRPTAACFNSLTSPTATLVVDMVSRIPSPSAARELAAAGLRNLVVHDVNLPEGLPAASMPDVEVIHHGPAAVAFRIHAAPATHHDTGMLRPFGFVSPQKLPRAEREASLALDVENRSDAVWAQPHPIRLLAARARLQRADDPAPAIWQDGVLLLPLALDARARGRAVLRLGEVPVPGAYYIDLEVPELKWRLTTSSDVIVE